MKLLGGTPVPVDCAETDGFRLKPEALEQAITPRTKWLFLNMPGNPSGAVYSPAEQRALGDVLARHPQVLVLSDETCEHIIFDGRAFVSFGKACPELRERSPIVNGVSKSYAMTAWRVGYAAGPAPSIKVMANIQSQSVTSVRSIAQAATVAALNGPQGEVARFRKAFEARRNLVVDGLRSVNALSLSPPNGAFYAYLGCAGLIGRRTPSAITRSRRRSTSMHR